MWRSWLILKLQRGALYMNKNELFETWAPSASVWSSWAKPVLFAHWNAQVHRPPGPMAEPLPSVEWAPTADGTTAIVADLPGAMGARIGMSLAAKGYRPVPLYNAVPAPWGASRAVVDATSILNALVEGAEALRDAQLPHNAPPVFLLDADRRWGDETPNAGAFDNRSVSFPTDFPSARFLLEQGIKRALLVQLLDTAPQADLVHTLRLWQKEGIELLKQSLQPPTQVQPLHVGQPSILSWIFFRARMLLRLQRNPLGGFGGMIYAERAGG